MDKPLSNNPKTDKNPTQEEAKASQPAQGTGMPASSLSSALIPGGMTLGAYGPGSEKLSDLSLKSWDKKQAWNESPQGRLAIRMFSRGVLGAAFFAVGGHVANRWMSFEEDVGRGIIKQQGYNPTRGFGRQENPLQFIAKLIDTTVGAPIEWAVEKSVLAGTSKAKIAELAKQGMTLSEHAEDIGRRAVHFRPTQYTTRNVNNAGQKITVAGRTLGHETVMITFDFFCASIGDAFGRDIAGWFDPNVKKDWMDKNGKISFPKAIDTAVNSISRYVSYNGGEDWAVSIPYAYFMKGQRALINKFSPGFQYDFDRNLNGGSFKVSRDNKIKGNFALEGMLDLQSRFTVYNIGTLMYREAYDNIAEKLKGHDVPLYGAPDAKPDHKKGFGERMGNLAKWVARSVVKGGIYMTPAVPFFWITRSNQKKREGLFIKNDEGLLANVVTDVDDIHSVRALNYNRLSSQADRGKVKLTYDYYDPTQFKTGTRWAVDPSEGRMLTNPTVMPTSSSGSGRFSPLRENHEGLNRVFNKVAQFDEGVVNRAVAPANWLDHNTGYVGKGVTRALGVQSFNDLAPTFVRASMSYTPYMYAKAEAANLWDDGKMDMSVERLVDGAAKLNWGEFKAGASETWRSILHKPLADPEREKLAQHRIKIDGTPPADFLDTQDERRKAREAREQTAAPASSWQERVIAGQEDKEKDKEADKAAKPERKAGSYAEQESMKKALEQLKPPTSSIH